MRGGIAHVAHVAALPAAHVPLAIKNTPSSPEPSKRSKKHRKHRHAPDSPVSDDHDIQEDALVSTTSNAVAVQPQQAAHSHGPCEDVLVRGDMAMAVASASAATQALGPAILNDPTVMAVQALLTRVQSIIDEIQCWAVGLSTLITELQKTPETFAAVGLSLAEIAQLVTHITPAAAIILKSGFPTIFALISSPHFTFVVGVGAAATVVVLGGYKIVRSIIGGAEENLRLAESDADHLLAYGDLPDEDILEETTLGGQILGEVMEDRLLEAAPRMRDPLDGDYVAKPSAPKHERKMSTASADTAMVKLERKESRWGKKEKEKPLKDERKHDSKDREEHRERKKEKEGRSRRKEERPGKPERRRTLPRQSSNSSGTSTSGDDDRSRKSPRIGSSSSGSSSPKSTGSRSPKVGSSKSPKIGSDGKERKSPKIGSEKEKRKEKEKAAVEDKKKKRNFIKSLFSVEGGRSA